MLSSNLFKNKHSLKQLFASLLMTCTLAACVGNNGSNNTVATDSSSSKISSNSSKISIAAIPSIEESNSINSPLCYNTDHNLTLYSSNKEITATLSSCPTASYEIGFDANNHWVQKEFYNTDGASLILTFSADVPNDFHLSQIYNDLDTSSNLPIGKIEQIDSSDCDALISSGHTANQSCKIQFVYSGLATISNSYNDIHLLFNSPNNHNYDLDFDLKVANNLSSGQDFPILNVIGDQEEYSNYVNSITDNGNSMLYDNNYGYTLTNYGTGNITVAHSGDNSIVNINTGRHFSTVTNLAYGIPGQVTSCANSPLASQQSCTFPFYNLDTQKSIEYARFTYTYLHDTIVGQTTQYSHFAVLGYGDILPSDYEVTDTESPILLLKNNYGNQSDNTVIYNIPMANFKLTAELNSQLNIATIQPESANRLYYAFGDYGNAKLQDLLQKIDFVYDSSCFSGEFTDESQVASSYNCSVKLNLPNQLKSLSSGNATPIPFAFQLYASYDSATGDHIKELIGTVSVDLSSSSNRNN